jgi:O-methyltransferase
MIIDLYRKTKWFFKNYKAIGFDKKIVPVTSTVVIDGYFSGDVTYATDNLVTSNNCDFINEPRFKKAYNAAAKTNPWPGFTLYWRVYIVCWFADHVKHLDGDFVECGVNTGAYSRAVIDFIDFATLNKTFYLLDTFEGLVDEQISESEKEVGIDKIYAGLYRNVYGEVKETFAPFNVKIIKGMVPATLTQVDSQKICYLSIDMNVTEPEIAAVNYFWDCIVPGGVIILDDYGFSHHINQKLAFDNLAKEKDVQILTLPTGQGIIIKP